MRWNEEDGWWVGENEEWWRQTEERMECNVVEYVG